MKILLNQQGLDKPYSGGLGSFKLYVLVASHVSRIYRLAGFSKLHLATLIKSHRLCGIEDRTTFESRRSRLRC